MSTSYVSLRACRECCLVCSAWSQCCLINVRIPSFPSSFFTFHSHALSLSHTLLILSPLSLSLLILSPLYLPIISLSSFSLFSLYVSLSLAPPIPPSTCLCLSVHPFAYLHFCLSAPPPPPRPHAHTHTNSL